MYNILPSEVDDDKSITAHGYLPPVIVTGQKPYTGTANDPEYGMKFINTAMLGLPNNLFMSHNIGVIKDIFNPNKSWMDVFDSQVNGNNEVVSNEYAKEHPIKSNLINFGLDILSPSIIKGGIKGGIQSRQILRNIKHRNLLAFNNIEPFYFIQDENGNVITKNVVKN